MTVARSELTDLLASAAHWFEVAATGSDPLINTAFALRRILAIGARDDHRTAPHDQLERIRRAMRLALPVVEDEAGDELPPGRVAFGMEAAVGIVDLFGSDHDSVPRIDLTAIVHDRLSHTGLLAGELEVIAHRRDIAARGDVLRQTAAALQDGRLGAVVKLN